MLNAHKAHFLQPKLEIFGLYCTLRRLQLYIIGIHNLIVETDVRYIKGMPQNPNINLPPALIVGSFLS